MTVLLYLEDPGSANMAAGLESELAKRDQKLIIVAEPILQDYLKAKSINFEIRNSKRTAAEILDGISVLSIGISDNIDTFLHDLVSEARCLNIPSVALIDSAQSCEKRFRGRSENALEHCPDFLLLPDEISIQAYRALGMPDEKMRFTGHPNSDYVRARRAYFNTCDRMKKREEWLPGIGSRPIALFLAAPVLGYDEGLSYRSNDYTMFGRGQSTFRTTVSLEETLDAAREVAPDLSIVLRLHPKSDPRDFEIYHSEIAAISEGGDALEAVWASDIVLGLPTMLMVESLLMGRPALGVLPTPRELSYLAAFQWGLVPAVWTRHDLHVKLATFATWKIDKIALDTYCPPFAISRIADALVDLDCVNTSVQDAWTV